MLRAHRAITELVKEFAEMEKLAGNEIDVAWPNVVYTPTFIGEEPQPFLELQFAMSNTVPLTLEGNDGLDKVTGTFFINVRYATNSGAVRADDIVGRLLTLCHNGAQWEYDGTLITIMGNSVEPGAPDFGWYKVQCGIRYESYQRRT